ncbi:MAG: N-acetylneuraminate synthase [Candidatus Omnitrophica bacterium]|nr:N-acetylneuraminate synthase [Candidatus Omnitrophota bacterium]
MLKHKLNDKRVFIIAEIGVNHNGQIELAKNLIDQAAIAGVDAVKFQTFRPEEVMCQSTPKASYQLRHTDQQESFLDMVRRFQLNEQQHEDLLRYAQNKGVEFISSPFDLPSIDLLNRLKLKILKIPSGEITNLPYLRKMGKLKKKIIISTGMAVLKEIKTAVEILVQAGTVKKNITVLHCCTEYPAVFKDVNLRAMVTIGQSLGVKVGYSDHTEGIEVALAAVALGAQVIEKHFTLDKTMDGPDHQASLNPQELQQLVKAIRHVEEAMGNGVKKPSLTEEKNKLIIRKSIVARVNIRKGEIFSPENLTVKRPGTGLNPMLWDRIMGRKAQQDFKADEVIKS